MRLGGSAEKYPTSDPILTFGQLNIPGKAISPALDKGWVYAWMI